MTALADRNTVRRVGAVRWLPVALGVLAVLAEVGYPVVTGDTRTALTVATVLIFCAASVSHAVVWRGWRWAAVLVVVTAGGGLLVEAVGTSTGVPFGAYVYAGSLGPTVLGVPIVVPLAWTMLAYPAWVVAGRLVARPGARVGVAGVGLASWDLFLDPQMVAAGHWRWVDVRLSLPGEPAVPVSNYLGWLVVAVVMMAVLAAAAPATNQDADDRLPVLLYLWTYGSSVLANVAFFDRPLTALWGGLGMGLVAGPLLWSLRPGRPGRPAVP